jgi:N-acetylglucosaminyl-diphospho-decaprenol L-rhamnosyltransferase
MRWSAIITTYNSGLVIADAIDSLLNLDPSESPADIIVVDNDSADGTAEAVSEYGERVTLIRNEANLGLSAANNVGAAAAGGDSLFFLNPDVRILPGAVSALCEFQQSHPEAALLGPAMLDEEGDVQSTARTWPTPITVAARRTSFGNTSMGRRIANDHLHRFTVGSAVRPHWLVGAAIWLTPFGREEVGLMSERYFLYFEDVEWCLRAWKRNSEVWYVPQAVISHGCRRESVNPGTAMKHHLRSMFRFFGSHPLVALGFGPGE